MIRGPLGGRILFSSQREGRPLVGLNPVLVALLVWGYQLNSEVGCGWECTIDG